MDDKYVDDALDYDFASLRSFFICSSQSSSESNIPNHAIDWTGCVEKETEYPIAVGGCGELFMGRWNNFPAQAGVVPKVIIKDVRMLADEFHNEKVMKKKRYVGAHLDYPCLRCYTLLSSTL